MEGHLNISNKIVHDLKMKKVSAKLFPKIVADGKSLCGRRLGLLLFTKFRIMEISPSI
jgi:hypothetical protein